MGEQKMILGVRVENAYGDPSAWETPDGGQWQWVGHCQLQELRMGRGGDSSWHPPLLHCDLSLPMAVAYSLGVARKRAGAGPSAPGGDDDDDDAEFLDEGPDPWAVSVPAEEAQRQANVIIETFPCHPGPRFPGETRRDYLERCRATTSAYARLSLALQLAQFRANDRLGSMLQFVSLAASDNCKPEEILPFAPPAGNATEGGHDAG